MNLRTVYDILNAGPNHRFTVRGKNGKPFIVSNCVQALARKIIIDQTMQVRKRYPVVMTTHDELVAVVPYEERSEAVDWIKSTMESQLSWWPELPLEAEVSNGERYGDIK